MARIARHRTTKAQMVEVVRELAQTHGLGNVLIAEILGFTREYIHRIRKDFGMPNGTNRAHRDMLLKAVDPALCAKCDAIYKRSIAAATDGNPGKGSVSGRLRKQSVLDEDQGSCKYSCREDAHSENASEAAD